MRVPSRVHQYSCSATDEGNGRGSMMIDRVRKGRLQANRVVLMGAVVLLASSCATEPGRLTGLGGAAGGALGAGLGALVGSQTGDPTTGLIMGGAAGSVAGAAAGNVFEAEEVELADRRTVMQERDREISQRREQIAALRSRSAVSDLDRYPEDASSDYFEPPRRPIRDSARSDSIARPASERRSPSSSILPLDMEDVRPIYVERRPGGRPRWEPTSEQRVEQTEPEKPVRDEVTEKKAMPRRAFSSLNDDARVLKTARVESNVGREVRRDTTASVRTAPVQTAPVLTSPVKIVAPVRKVTEVTKESREEEKATRPALPALKQSTTKAVERGKDVRIAEAPVKSARRESRVVSEERQPEAVRTTRKVESPASAGKLSVPVTQVSSKPSLPVRPAPGLLAKENTTQPRESRTQTPSKVTKTIPVRVAEDSRGGPVSKSPSVETRVKSETKGRDAEVTTKRSASQVAASSLKKELAALAKRPVSDQEKPVVIARKAPQASASAALKAPDQQKQSSTETGSVQRASGECGQASQEIEKSKQVSEPAEKLFHYRRALRLCPSEARYHVHLGDHYRSLKRDADANFEYKEALALDPSNAEVKKKVEELKNG